MKESNDSKSDQQLNHQNGIDLEETFFISLFSLLSSLFWPFERRLDECLYSPIHWNCPIHPHWFVLVLRHPRLNDKQTEKRESKFFFPPSWARAASIKQEKETCANMLIVRRLKCPREEERSFSSNWPVFTFGKRRSNGHWRNFKGNSYSHREMNTFPWRVRTNLIEGDKHRSSLLHRPVGWANKSHCKDC